MQPITVGFSPCPSSAAYNSGVQPVSFLCITGITGITGITVGTFLGDVKVHPRRLLLFKSKNDAVPFIDHTLARMVKILIQS